jgi:hypothetical protein
LQFQDDAEVLRLTVWLIVVFTGIHKSLHRLLPEDWVAECGFNDAASLVSHVFTDEDQVSPVINIEW